MKWLWILLTGCSHKDIKIINELGRTTVEECTRCKTKFYIQKE